MGERHAAHMLVTIAPFREVILILYIEALRVCVVAYSGTRSVK